MIVCYYLFIFRCWSTCVRRGGHRLIRPPVLHHHLSPLSLMGRIMKAQVRLLSCTIISVLSALWGRRTKEAPVLYHHFCPLGLMGRIMKGQGSCPIPSSLSSWPHGQDYERSNEAPVLYHHLCPLGLMCRVMKGQLRLLTYTIICVLSTSWAG
jgi:hypothetical protein